MSSLSLTCSPTSVVDPPESAPLSNPSFSLVDCHPTLELQPMSTDAPEQRASLIESSTEVSHDRGEVKAMAGRSPSGLYYDHPELNTSVSIGYRSPNEVSPPSTHNPQESFQPLLLPSNSVDIEEQVQEDAANSFQPVEGQGQGRLVPEWEPNEFDAGPNAGIDAALLSGHRVPPDASILGNLPEPPVASLLENETVNCESDSDSVDQHQIVPKGSTIMKFDIAPESSSAFENLSYASSGQANVCTDSRLRRPLQGQKQEQTCQPTSEVDHESHLPSMDQSVPGNQEGLAHEQAEVPPEQSFSKVSNSSFDKLSTGQPSRDSSGSSHSLSIPRLRSSDEFKRKSLPAALGQTSSHPLGPSSHQPSLNGPDMVQNFGPNQGDALDQDAILNEQARLPQLEGNAHMEQRNLANGHLEINAPPGQANSWSNSCKLITLVFVVALLLISMGLYIKLAGCVSRAEYHALLAQNAELKEAITKLQEESKHHASEMTALKKMILKDFDVATQERAQLQELVRDLEEELARRPVQCRVCMHIEWYDEFFGQVDIKNKTCSPFSESLEALHSPWVNKCATGEHCSQPSLSSTNVTNENAQAKHNEYEGWSEELPEDPPLTAKGRAHRRLRLECI